MWLVGTANVGRKKIKDCSNIHLIWFNLVFRKNSHKVVGMAKVWVYMLHSYSNHG